VIRKLVIADLGGRGDFFKLSTPYILAITYFFISNNVHNILNTYIYHQLPPICLCVCYSIFKENTGLLAQKLYSFCNVVEGGFIFRRK
jgi:hypothetical protein